MKFKFLTGLLFITLAINVISCTEDEAEDIENILPDDDVNGDDRDAFIGNWSVNETSDSLGIRNYTVQIEKDSSFPQRVNIYNFYALGTEDSIVANVSTVSPNTITVPYQTLSGNYIGGTGTLASGKITFEYTVVDGNDSNNVKATYIK